MEDGNQWRRFPDPHLFDRSKQAINSSLLHPSSDGIYFLCSWIWADAVTHFDQIPSNHHAVRKPKLAILREGPHEETPPRHQACKWRHLELSRHPRHRLKAAKWGSPADVTWSRRAQLSSDLIPDPQNHATKLRAGVRRGVGGDRGVQ